MPRALIRRLGSKVWKEFEAEPEVEAEADIEAMATEVVLDTIALLEDRIHGG